MNTSLLCPPGRASGALRDAMSRHYSLATQQPGWTPSELASGAVKLSDAWQEWAWRATSASVYAEQTGMMVACRLSHEVEDLSARMCLATAASDEARHVDTFVFAAESLGGNVLEPPAEIDSAYQRLFELPSWKDRFVVHTLLECYAADEFFVVARKLADSLPGRCYRYVRRDEARHVKMGLTYLSQRCSDPDFGETRARLGELQRFAHVVGGVDDDFYARLAAMSGCDAPAMRLWFERRQRARLVRAFGPIAVQRDGDDCPAGGS